MAFNPFDVFRRNQKILFAILTIIVMFMFVLQFGQGDFFSWFPRWLGSKRQGGDVMAVVDGAKVYESQLEGVKRHRVLANRYMAAAAARAGENLRKYVTDSLTRVSTENKPTVQAVLDARQSGYFSPDMGRRYQFAQMGFGPPPSPDEMLSDRERTIAALLGALNGLMTSATAKPDDKDVAQSAAILMTLDQTAGGAHYFVNQPNQTNRDALEFLLWTKKADQLGIRFAPDEVMTLANAEFYRKMTAEDWQAADDAVRGSQGFTKDVLLSALGDEFRVRAAQAAVIGQGLLRPLGNGYDAPYDYYQFYRDQCTPARYGLITVPAENYLTEAAKLTPTEQELVNLFKAARNQEPNPASPKPALREPRRLKLEFVELTGKEPYYTKAAADGAIKSEVLAKVAGFLVAPLGPAQPTPAALLAAPAVLNAPDLILRAQYDAYKRQHAAAVQANWTGSPFGGPPRPLDPHVAEPANVASLAAAIAGALATHGPALAPAVNLVANSFAADRIAKTELFRALMLPPIGGGVAGFGSLFGVAKGYAPFVQPLSLAAVRGQLQEKATAEFARQLAGEDMTKFTADLAKLGQDADKKKAEEAVKKFAADRGLTVGKSADFRDVYHIVGDPGLKPLAERFEAAAKMAGGYLDPSVFGRQFFYESNPLNPRQAQPSTGLFKPQPFPGFAARPTADESAFLVWRTAEQAADSPRSLDAPGVKERAVAEWRKQKARELAKTAAEELAKKCQNLGESQVVIEPKLRDIKAEFAGKFADPAAKERVQYHEIDRVAPLVTDVSFQPGRSAVGPFSLGPTPFIPYPTTAMVSALVDNKDKPASTALTLADSSGDRQYVAVLLGRNEKMVDEFGITVYGGSGPFNDVGAAVSRRHQDELRRTARDQAVALLKAEFGYEKEHENVNKRSEDLGE
ncbi:MAG: hypothetical protein U0871_18445 [Gemmataceae bacterium]